MGGEDLVFYRARETELGGVVGGGFHIRWDGRKISEFVCALLFYFLYIFFGGVSFALLLGLSIFFFIFYLIKVLLYILSCLLLLSVVRVLSTSTSNSSKSLTRVGMRWETTYIFFRWEKRERNELLQWENWSSQHCRKVYPSDLQNPPESSLLMHTKKLFALSNYRKFPLQLFIKQLFSLSAVASSRCCFPSEARDTERIRCCLFTSHHYGIYFPLLSVPLV